MKPLGLGLLGLLCATSLTFADGRRLEVLFLGDTGHHVPAERFYDILPQLGPRGVNLEYTENLDDLNPAKLAQYDALAIYANWDKLGDPKKPGSQQARESAIFDYVRKEGHGLVVLHCGSFCFRDSLAFVKMTGGQFSKHGTGDFETTITAPEHPIMKGFTPFKTWDETYVHTAHNDEGRTILQKREDEPYTWVRNEGAGRVFYTAYGHDGRTWLQPSFGDLVYRGMKWAAGDAAGAQLDALKLPALTYTDSPSSPVPNYEGRSPAPQLQNPLSPADSAKHTQVPAGTERSLFASEESSIGLWNVIDLKFDEKGRLWTVEVMDYPNERKPQGEGRDRIRILEDTNGDGVADKATVFATGLSIATSLVFANGGVIVSTMPDVFFLKDTNGDGVSDERRVLFTGFMSGGGHPDTHATVSSLRYGHDGWIWGTVGYDGFRGTVGGEQVSFGAGAFRFKQDGSKLEQVGRTSNNTWGIGFTENFDIIGSTANNNPAWYMAIPRRYYAAAGMDSGIAPGIEAQGTKRAAIIRPYVRMVDVFQKYDWGYTWGYTAAAGQTIYTGRSFPQEYWNRASFVTEPTAHIVCRNWLTPKGTDFSWERGWNLMASNDEWFAPVETTVGPDGAVWVSDFYSFLIQHNPTPSPQRGGFAATTGAGNAFVSDLRDTAHARIWRVAAKGGQPSGFKPLAASDTASLLDGLGSTVMNTRLHAQRLLVERGNKDVVPQLQALAGKKEVDAAGISGAAQHAVWTLAGLGALDDATAAAALAHPAEGVRRAALAGLPRTEAGAAAVVKSGALNDKEPRVRLSALLALADMPASAAAGQALAALTTDKAVKEDKYLPTALTFAASRHAAGFLRAVLAAAPVLTTEDPAAPVERKNLLPNPGFEEIENGKPKGWTTTVHSGKATFSVAETGHTGGHSLLIESLEGGDTSWNTTVPVDADSEYELTAWIKTKDLNTRGGGKGAQIELHSLNGAQPASKAVKGNVDWARHSFRFKTGKQREIIVNLLYGGWGHATGQAWWDDATLVKLGSASAAADGGPDLEAITRIFAKSATGTDLAALHTAIAAKKSAAARIVATALSVPAKAAAPVESQADLAKTHQKIILSTKEGLMFDQAELTAAADKPVALLFKNPDLLQHNVVFGQPGSYDKLNAAALAQLTQPDAIANNYVPKIPEVIASSRLLNAGESEILKFTLKAGDYPYVCTFPGHAVVMRGVLKVK